VVPGLSAPAKLAGFGLVPVTLIVKFAALAEPPLSFTTCLITWSVPVVGAATSSFVTVQVFVWPAAIVPVQSAEKLAVYPLGPVSVTL
jgi:hypothetical protein